MTDRRATRLAGHHMAYLLGAGLTSWGMAVYKQSGRLRPVTTKGRMSVVQPIAPRGGRLSGAHTTHTPRQLLTTPAQYPPHQSPAHTSPSPTDNNPQPAAGSSPAKSRAGRFAPAVHAAGTEASGMPAAVSVALWRNQHRAGYGIGSGRQRSGTVSGSFRPFRAIPNAHGERDLLLSKTHQGNWRLFG